MTEVLLLLAAIALSLLCGAFVAAEFSLTTVERAELAAQLRAFRADLARLEPARPDASLDIEAVCDVVTSGDAELVEEVRS